MLIDLKQLLLKQVLITLGIFKSALTCEYGDKLVTISDISINN